MRSVLICLFLVACATSQGGGQAKSEAIAEKVEAAQRVLNDPKATPEQRAQASRKLDEATKAARDLGRQNDATHKVNADLSAQVDTLKKYRNFLIAGGIAIAGLLFWRLKS